jgi:Tfp pilus assembly protein PilN
MPPTAKDISNRSMFARLSLEWLVGTIISVIVVIFAAGGIYRAFADGQQANTGAITKLVEQQKTQAKDIDEIKDSVDDVQQSVDALQRELKLQNEKQTEKMDLMLKILEGDFDRR